MCVWFHICWVCVILYIEYKVVCVCGSPVILCNRVHRNNARTERIVYAKGSLPFRLYDVCVCMYINYSHTRHHTTRLHPPKRMSTLCGNEARIRAVIHVQIIIRFRRVASAAGAAAESIVNTLPMSSRSRASFHENKRHRARISTRRNAIHGQPHIVDDGVRNRFAMIAERRAWSDDAA